MNRYQLLKKNHETMYQFIKAGILSFIVLRDIEIYEEYQQLKKMKNNEAKFLYLGDKHELSAVRIEQIVYNMQKKVN
ncbi:hypothetical protein LZZ90_08375 [Flavobacterium sp. SM15]|uniref:hypothetical protein n=1 Tax=Flavobacterium sp. SM15 TaxID=2908005 RepID=UPI001EDBC7A4|nr:hypothetical protein [Flavobacterium sp. SM15]MCG2611522.1 hypothetical protein [Flavobacterium sp. SM15]